MACTRYLNCGQEDHKNTTNSVWSIKKNKELNMNNILHKFTFTYKSERLQGLFFFLRKCLNMQEHTPSFPSLNKHELRKIPLWSDETLMRPRVKAKAKSLCPYDFKQWRQKRPFSGLARGRPQILSNQPHPLFHRSGFAPVSYANSKANPGKEHDRVFGSYCTVHQGRSLLAFFLLLNVHWDITTKQYPICTPQKNPV